MAEGIDTESHTAAMKAGGRTIAVLGTGVDVIYPQKNRDLYKQILTAGLVVSEYPTKTPPDRTHFPRRNRIIAGMSRAILVMEAPLKSGKPSDSLVIYQAFKVFWLSPGYYEKG